MRRNETKHRRLLLIVEFCVVGIARTSKRYRQGVPYRAWQDKVREHAGSAMAGSALMAGSADLRVTEFSTSRSKDRDNVVKPIQDALQGVVYANDRQVQRLECDWRDINGLFRVRSMSAVAAAALVAGHEFVWIRVHEHQPDEDLTL